MTVKAFVCTCCGDTLYSRCVGDERECHCGRSRIKGTGDNRTTPDIYVNDRKQNATIFIKGEELLVPEMVDLTLPFNDPDILWWDWNLMTDHYGLISDYDNAPAEASQTLEYSLYE